MSGTDPKGKWFGKKGDPTQPFVPGGSGPEHTLPSDLPKIPGITLHYEIARGGMGVVYSGRQDFLDRRVAVKLLSVDLGGAAFAQRFQREAKILAGISHPNIVGCHMADTTPEGQSYLVMEFCDGPPLKSWIAENGPVAPMAAIRLIRASAQALAFAYQSDIIHRDVKPENILLETVTSTSLDIKFPFTPKIVDLGLARIAHEQVGEGLTSPGSVMGTPSTMSPEQFDDPDSVDFRSDIYGLGCCLYEMLVGKPAFTGNKLTDIVLAKRDPCSPNPCDEDPSLPAAVGAFTQRLLACSRDDRPASYKDLDTEADKLMTALLAQRTPAAEEDDPSGFQGQTIPSGPGAFPRAGTVPAVPQSAGTKPIPQIPDQPKGTSPASLNTGELDYLSEGGPAGGSEPPPPAFRDGGSSGTSPTNPMGGGSPAGSKKGLYIGVVALVAVVLGVVFGMGGGNANPNTGANKTTVAQIKMFVDGSEATDSIVDLGAEFELSVAVTNVDSDKVDYKWTWPKREINPVSQMNGARVGFRLVDGLPGVEHLVQLEVRGANGAAPVTRDYRIVVGKCREQKPFIVWATQELLEEVSGIWRDKMDPANPADAGAAGRVRGSEIAVLRADVGKESYWEWEGTLQPTGHDDGEASALVTINYGTKGYAIRCDLLKDETEWTVQILEQVPGGNEWRPRMPAVKATWVQPELSDATSRGWYSLRRVDKQLILQVGEYAQPAPVDGEPLKVPTIVRRDPVTIDLTSEECAQLGSSGQLQFCVTKARCVFRAIKR